MWRLPRVWALPAASISTPSTSIAPKPTAASDMRELVREPHQTLGEEVQRVVGVRRMCCLHALAASALATTAPILPATAITV